MLGLQIWTPNEKAHWGWEVVGDVLDWSDVWNFRGNVMGVQYNEL